MKTSMEGNSILLLCTSLLSIFILSAAIDTINASQSISDGQSLVSAGGTYELGFFSPAGNSARRYLGIWYKEVSTTTAVWVANRETPFLDSSGVLKFTNGGILVLLNRNETIIWSTNSSRSAVNPVAQLLESGNLVVRDGNGENPENFLWQSFDYPCDTHLPGMKLGRHTITGKEWYLSSWKSPDDPARGNFTYRLDPQGFPQLVIRDGSNEIFRSGPWNGLRFSGFPSLRPNSIYTFYFVFNQTDMYYSYDLINNSVITSCNIDNSPICGCLNGFVAKFQKDWDISDWSNGCVRRTALDCQSGDGFVKYSGVKLPDTRYSWFNESMSLEECNMVCLRNCSCMAYASLNISAGGSGCLLWFADLIDIKVFIQNGQEIYIRMASSEVGMNSSPKL
ncbi:hypothetical protein L1049_001193 [Liquidambar formosana]|uniref:Uncharacterized protein n=1 Tax=Liquidambar formosana TaxID=63359 RepID=A0AAP0NCV4_LIQFO